MRTDTKTERLEARIGQVKVAIDLAKENLQRIHRRLSDEVERAGRCMVALECDERLSFDWISGLRSIATDALEAKERLDKEYEVLKALTWVGEGK